MSKAKHQCPEFLWVQFPSALMEIVDIKPISVFHPPIFPTHIALRWNCKIWINYGGRTVPCVIEVFAFWFVKICKRIFLLCVVNVEKVMITVQTPNDADEWPILMCHDNEVTMYRVLAGLILEQEVALCLVCVDLGQSGLTVEAKIVLWRFQPKSQPDLTFQNNSLFFPSFSSMIRSKWWFFARGSKNFYFMCLSEVR